MSEYDSFEDARIKHLEMIQAVIARLGNDGFIVKGWAVTVAGAFYGFALTESEWRLGLASIVVTLAFWGIDTYFLRAERLFRELYGQVRARQEGLEPFVMSATGESFSDRVRSAGKENLLSWWRTARRPTLIGLYATLIAAAVALIAIVGTSSGPKARSEEAGPKPQGQRQHVGSDSQGPLSLAG